LRGLYRKAGIPKNRLSERAKYLAETVLNLKLVEQDLINRIAKKKGRAVALNFLEDMVILQHQRLIEETEQTIPVPLK